MNKIKLHSGLELEPDEFLNALRKLGTNIEQGEVYDSVLIATSISLCIEGISQDSDWNKKIHFADSQINIIKRIVSSLKSEL